MRMARDGIRGVTGGHRGGESTYLGGGAVIDTSCMADEVAVVGRRWRGSWRLLETPWVLLNEELDLLIL